MITMMFAGSAAEERGDDDHQRDVRDHEEVVGDPHQHGVRLPAEEAGEDADGAADQIAEIARRRSRRAARRWRPRSAARPCSRRRRPSRARELAARRLEDAPTCAFGSPSTPGSGPTTARKTKKPRIARPDRAQTGCREDAGIAVRTNRERCGSGRRPSLVESARPESGSIRLMRVTRGSNLKYRRSASRLKKITDSVRSRNAAWSTGSRAGRSPRRSAARSPGRRRRTRR